MERPTVTKEMILEAATKIAENLDGDAETIAEYYEHPMDGYQLAKELDRGAYWDITMSDVEELDGNYIGQGVTYVWHNMTRNCRHEHRATDPTCGKCKWKGK